MKTAYRERTSPSRSEAITFRCVSGTTADHPDHEHIQPYAPSQELYEEITPNSDGSHKAAKSFEHYKVLLGEPQSNVGFPVFTDQWGYYPNHYFGEGRDPYAGYTQYGATGTIQPYGDGGMLDSELPLFYLKRQDGGFVPQPYNLDELLSRSLRTMLPSIKKELSLVNSVWELKDLVSLKQTVSGVLQHVAKPSLVAFKSFKRSIGNLVKQKREDLRVSSDVYLQWKFNISPLISDIAGIFLAVKRLERRINDLVTRSGCVQNRHFAWVWREFVDEYDEKLNVGYFSDQYRLNPLNVQNLSRSVSYDPTAFHAQIRYNFNYSGYQIAHARLLSLLDAFGVNLNPQIIWNAVPWSFVIDWVLGVGQYLDSLKLENMKPQINILEFLWSVKRQRRIMVTKWLTPNGTIGAVESNSRTRLPVVYESAYRRSVGYPSVSSIESSGLSLTEFSLGAALVLSRRRHLTGRIKKVKLGTFFKDLLVQNSNATL
jgi:hypothetical protein